MVTALLARPEDALTRAGTVDNQGIFTRKDLTNNTYYTDIAILHAIGGRQLAPDRYQIGAVLLDATSRTLSLPATLNMRDGIIEYALVTEEGKRHESLATTTARPEEIHVARLLLGMARTNPTAQNIEIRVNWQADSNKTFRLNELINIRSASSNREAQWECEVMSSGAWHYAGSTFAPGGFAASREGSIVAVIRDPSALVENWRSDGLDDTCHEPVTSLLPATGTPIRVEFHFP